MQSGSNWQTVDDCGGRTTGYRSGNAAESGCHSRDATAGMPQPGCHSRDASIGISAPSLDHLSYDGLPSPSLQNLIARIDGLGSPSYIFWGGSRPAACIFLRSVCKALHAGFASRLKFNALPGTRELGSVQSIPAHFVMQRPHADRQCFGGIFTMEVGSGQGGLDCFAFGSFRDVGKGSHFVGI